jgi:pyruvate dehydrogenase E2 component (dihydrolipoamide acetyltransferase)
VSAVIEIRVPDIGDFEDVEVVEILVAKGDRVELEDSLVSLESDKATMEIPSPEAGVIQEVRVNLGDQVSEGTLLVVLEADVAAAVGDSAGEPDRADAAEPSPAPAAVSEVAAPGSTGHETPPPPAAEVPAASGAAVAGPSALRAPPVARVEESAGPRPHASPLVRSFARQLGVDLGDTQGDGPHGRILKEDVKRYVRDRMGGSASPAAGVAPVPAVDWSAFGPVEEAPLGRIRRTSARNLTRSWQNVPHVTQHEDADVTDLEAFRKQHAAQAAARDLRLSPLLFVMKASVIALREFPDMRSSLDADGESLVVKQYYHLGVAVDTDQGLVVPVVRDVDRKGIYELAAEVAALAERARARKLTPTDLQGACFTISSLGGIGGRAFTPIVNAPEVAILGLSRLSVQPRWSAGLDTSAEGEGRFEPRLVLPLSLSYDHRVIDGALAARFAARLATLLSHPGHLLL